MAIRLSKNHLRRHPSKRACLLSIVLLFIVQKSTINEMVTINSRFTGKTVFVAVAIFAASSPAQAGFIMTIQQVGSDVVETGSGTVNSSALTYSGSITVSGYVYASAAFVIAGSGTGTVGYYSGISGPSNFGSGGLNYANSNSGDELGIYGDGGKSYLPVGYISGSALSDTSTYTNKTLAGLGLTTGTYTWTWGSGATADFFELDIGQSSTPEPSTFGLLALAAAGLMLGCCFRRVPVL